RGRPRRRRGCRNRAPELVHGRFPVVRRQSCDERRRPGGEGLRDEPVRRLAPVARAAAPRPRRLRCPLRAPDDCPGEEDRRRARPGRRLAERAPRLSGDRARQARGPLAAGGSPPLRRDAHRPSRPERRRAPARRLTVESVSAPQAEAVSPISLDGAARWRFAFQRAGTHSLLIWPPFAIAWLFLIDLRKDAVAFDF